MVHLSRLLRWLYLGRLTIATGIFGGALLIWSELDPAATRLATLVLVITIITTAASWWYTHLRRAEPGRTFLYTQVVFDTLLVTTVVHLTGGSQSDFATLYILVIAAAGLLLPLPGGVLIGGLASTLYFADIVLLHGATTPWTVFTQIAVFALVALATGVLGDKLRQTGAALDEAELELRRLRLETDEVLGTLDTGVLTIDPLGRLVYLNPAAARLLDLPAEVWLERSVLDELELRVAGLGYLVRRTIEHRDPVHWFEGSLAENGANSRVLGVRTTVLDRPGGATWASIVVQDITGHKRLDELDRRAARLKIVADLAASLAHEIRNPLASIRSAAEQLAGAELDAADARLLRRLVVKESDRLSQLLGDFIELSQVRPSHWTPLDLRTVLASALEATRRHPEGRNGVRIEYSAPAEPIPLEGDEVLLHRALFNLLLNAVQHAGHAGTVHLEAAPIPEPQLPPGIAIAAPVRVVVTDTGPGVPAEYRTRIFDPFFSTRQGGAGLGLSLVNRAVDAHHGAVLLDREYDAGARFTIYLPAHPGDHEPI